MPSRTWWHNSPDNTLPPPDMAGVYQRSCPLPIVGIEKRKAWIVGGGIAGLAAAFYLIRDGHMPAANHSASSICRSSTHPTQQQLGARSLAIDQPVRASRITA